MVYLVLQNKGFGVFDFIKSLYCGNSATGHLRLAALHNAEFWLISITSCKIVKYKGFIGTATIVAGSCSWASLLKTWQALFYASITVQTMLPLPLFPPANLVVGQDANQDRCSSL